MAPTTTTTTMTPLWKKPLLCSFEAPLSPNLTFPEDGLCDINFFQALEGNHTFLITKGGDYEAAFDTFLAKAAKQNESEHGVGLDYNIARTPTIHTVSRRKVSLVPST
ncbi:uncharacterized protein [Dermacentor albipictus]|uniref:uncharacterized protein isoform X2 n=1 Tax=Dermacentor albipictus TaxID=60249 RepID=UPI0031FD825F